MLTRLELVADLLQAIVHLASTLDAVLLQLILHHLWRPSTVPKYCLLVKMETVLWEVLCYLFQIQLVQVRFYQVWLPSWDWLYQPQPLLGRTCLAHWPLFIKQPRFSVRTLCELKLMVVCVTRESGHNASLQRLLHVIHESKKWSIDGWRIVQSPWLAPKGSWRYFWGGISRCMSTSEQCPRAYGQSLRSTTWSVKKGVKL